MFTSPADHTLGTDFSDMGEGKKFTCHQFHVKGWGAQEFEGHAPVVMHNTTGCAVPLIWILLNSQLAVDLFAISKMLVNIRRMQGEDSKRVHCNSGVKIVDKVGDLPGYRTIWYKPTGIANILLMLRATKKFWVVFNSEGGNFLGWSSRTGK